MRVFVIGDVHGCFHTFRTLVENYWERDREILIQLGDIVDRGNYVPQSLEYCQELKRQYPQQTIFLMGNHEDGMRRHILQGSNAHWLKYGGQETLEQFKNAGKSLHSQLEWIENLQLSWENNSVFLSHAGIARDCFDPYQLDQEDNILWTRKPLKNLGKLQIVGHTPVQTHSYNAESDTWYIDTGAVFGGSLTGAKISLSTQNKIQIEWISINTLNQDYIPRHTNGEFA